MKSESEICRGKGRVFAYISTKPNSILLILMEEEEKEYIFPLRVYSLRLGLGPFLHEAHIQLNIKEYVNYPSD